MDVDVDSRWLEWPLFLLWLFLFVKAFTFLRDRFGTEHGGFLEFLCALCLASWVAPFMPVIWIVQAINRRNEAKRVEEGRPPLNRNQLEERRHLILGSIVLGTCGYVFALVMFGLVT